jgi:hypothetical protein
MCSSSSGVGEDWPWRRDVHLTTVLFKKSFHGHAAFVDPSLRPVDREWSIISCRLAGPGSKGLNSPGMSPLEQENNCPHGAVAAQLTAPHTRDASALPTTVQSCLAPLVRTYIGRELRWSLLDNLHSKPILHQHLQGFHHPVLDGHTAFRSLLLPSSRRLEQFCMFHIVNAADAPSHL